MNLTYLLNHLPNRFQRCLALLLLLGSTLCNFSLAQTSFEAVLSGSQEALPVLTTASGLISGTLNGDTLVIEGEFSGLSSNFNAEIAGGAHIHIGYAGSNGGVTISLVTALDEDLRGGQFLADSNTFILDETQLNALQTRQLYVNIHTETFPSGELRGQILPSSSTPYSTNLFGSNEVPSVISSGSGAVIAELDGDQLIVSGSFSGLESGFNEGIAGGAHIHLAPAGRNGGVIFPLTTIIDSTDTGGIFPADSNTFTLSAGQVDSLELRYFYVNIHSDSIASGEIRGQLTPIPVAAFRVHLSGTNEVPSVTTSANGQLIVEWKDSTFVVSGSFNGLESALNTDILGGVHIHTGLAGTNGPVEVVLNPTTDSSGVSGVFLPEDNTFPLNDTLTTNNISRSLYVNIHSLENASGEIRGQVLPQSQYFFQAALTGTQEVRPVLTSAYGAIAAEILGDQVTVSGSFTGLESDFNTAIAGGAHIHSAAAGSNGPVEFILTSVIDPSSRAASFFPDSNSFSLTATQLDTLRDRLNYVNIHSVDIASGEIRGQLVHEATNYYVAPLSGTSEVDIVNSEASGTVILEQTGDQITASGSFNNLSSDLNTDIAGGAHIHFNFAGSNGPVIFILNSNPGADLTSGVFPVDSNIFSLAEGQLDTIRNRQSYVNIHSLNFAPGEIRGQLLPQAVSFFTSTLRSKNEVDPQVSTAGGDVKFELSGSKLIVSGSFAGLESQFNEQIAGGAHLHTGFVGENGGVTIPLVTSVSADSLAGIFLPDSNTFELDSIQVDAIRAEGLYVNIHSDSIASGEIRGQVLKESNFFPGDSATITAPEDGAVITLTGLNTDEFTPQWTGVADPDNNLVGYIWQLAADDSFQTIVVNTAVGPNTSFTTTFGFVDTLLASVGIGIGDSITLFHRAIATDGSVCAEGPAASVTLIRDSVITSIQEALPQGFNFQYYPSPARDVLAVEMEAPQQTEISLQVFNLLGKVLIEKNVTLRTGVNQEQLHIQQLSGGVYFLRLIIDKEIIGTEKFIKE